MSSSNDAVTFLESPDISDLESALSEVIIWGNKKQAIKIYFVFRIRNCIRLFIQS